MKPEQTHQQTRERPIIFSAEMVRAILAGTKTQTRRVVKPQPVRTRNGWEWQQNPMTLWYWPGGLHTCPYGKPGDRLYVREAWRAPSGWDATPGGQIFHDVETKYEADGFVRSGVGDGCWGRYRHARFMPQKVSRITLEITGVRVHQLEDMGAAECAQEGIGELTGADMYECADDAVRRFRKLWISLHGEWDDSLWVWALTFKRTE